MLGGAGGARILAGLIGLVLSLVAAPSAFAVCSSVTTTTAWKSDVTSAQSWGNSSNWTGGVPTTCSAVTIAPDVDPSPLTLSGIPTLELASLSVGPGVELMDGDLTAGDLGWTVDGDQYNNRIEGQITVLDQATFGGTGDTFVTGGLTTNGPTTIQSADFQLHLAGGGDLGFDGALTINGAVDIQGAAAGTARFGGGVTVGGLSAVPLSLTSMAGVTVDSTLTLNNGGDITMTGSAVTYTADAAISGSGVVSHAGASATLALEGPVPLSGGATLELGGGQLTGPGPLSGTGAFSWQEGTIDGAVTLGSGIATTVSGPGQKFLGNPAAITNQGTFTVLEAQTIHFTSGSPTFATSGTLAGGGTIEADVTNSGIVAPTGVLTVDGDYEQTGAGELRADVGESGADQLAITGAASLDGTLRIVNQTGFVPDDTETFDVVGHASRTGTFDTVLGKVINANRHYEVDYTSTSATSLTVEPGGGPILNVADAQAAEGSALQFAVSLSEDATEPVTVSYATANGTAGEADYTSTSGELEIPTGADGGTITVPTTQDGADEPNETLTLSLSQPDQAAIGDGSATGTVVDDDVPAATQAPLAPLVVEAAPPSEPGPPLPRPAGVAEICVGSRTLTLGSFVITGCFTQEGQRYIAAGDVEVNGLLLRPRAGTGKIVVDLAAKTITGSAAPTIIDVLTPREPGKTPGLLGRLDELGQAANAAVKVYWDLSKSTGQQAARLIAQGLVLEGVKLLAGQSVEIFAGNLKSLDLAFDAAVTALGNAYAKLKIKVQNALVANQRFLAKVVSNVALLTRFELRDVEVDKVGSEWVGTAKLLVGSTETALTLRFDKNEIREAHAASQNELRVLGGSGLPGAVYLDSYSLDLFNVNGTYELIGRAAISGRHGGDKVVSASDHGLNYTVAPDGRWVLATGGTGASVSGRALTNSAITVTSAGAFDFTGGVNVTNSIGRFVAASAAGWFDPPSRRFQIEGSGSLDLPAGNMLALSAQGIIGPGGHAACAEFSVVLLGQTVRVSIGFGQKPGELPKLIAASCDLAAYRAPRPTARAAQAGGTAVALPSGLPLAAFAVRGASGAPRVTLTGPDGRVVPVAGGRVEGGKVLAFEDAAERTTHLVVGAPPAGRYTIAPVEGSSPIADVLVANGLTAPAVKARVSGKGRRRVLSWTANANPGQRIAFFEQGGGTRKAIGAPVTGTKGTRRFAPADGKAGRRAIVAVVEQDGFPRETGTVGSYSAPAAAPVPVPRRVKARHAKTRLTITWKGASGVRSYRITVRPRRGTTVLLASRRPRVALADVARSHSGTITVQAVGRDGRLSRLGRGRFRASR